MTDRRSTQTGPPDDAEAAAREARAAYRGEALAVRAIVGGVLMGLANLVPGISGGTMLLAAGVYPQFIGGVAEVSTFRFRPATLLTLGCIVGAAVVAIVALAGPVSALVIHHQWVMYSLFIGLTLGGVPLLWRRLAPADPTVVVASIVGIVLMAILAWVEPGDAGGSGRRAVVMLFIAGVAGGSAMILPGVSGGYLLLVLGQYVTILTAIDAARAAAKAGDGAALASALGVFVPVGLGVAVGVVGVSNLLKLLLARAERPTLGVLLGLLLGAILGLWPFQARVAPAVGDVVKGVVLESEADVATVDPGDWPNRTFRPSAGQVAGSAGLVLAGLGASLLVARLGRDGDRPG